MPSQVPWIAPYALLRHQIPQGGEKEPLIGMCLSNCQFLSILKNLVDERKPIFHRGKPWGIGVYFQFICKKNGRKQAGRGRESGSATARVLIFQGFFSAGRNGWSQLQESAKNFVCEIVCALFDQLVF